MTIHIQQLSSQNCDLLGLECFDACRPVIDEMKEHPCFDHGLSHTFRDFYLDDINLMLAEENGEQLIEKYSCHFKVIKSGLKCINFLICFQGLSVGLPLLRWSLLRLQSRPSAMSGGRPAAHHRPRVSRDDVTRNSRGCCCRHDFDLGQPEK